MYISKTDYIEYAHCRKNVWLKKRKPEIFEGVELSAFEQKIIAEGNDADEAARVLFPEGVLVKGIGVRAVPETRSVLLEKPETIFQGAFMHEDFFVQADVLHFNALMNGWELYEVKASNNVKREAVHNHIRDLAFQKTVIERAGLPVVKTGVIHLNGEYVQEGERVDFEELFVVEDVSEEVIEAQVEVQETMEEMRVYLNGEEEAGCTCVYRGRSDQCTSFAYSNPDVPEYSVHDLNRIGGSKKLLYDWIDRGIYAFEDIDNPQVLKGAKKLQYDAYMLGRPIIDRQKIEEILGELQFPLQFFDYEGYSSAIPRFEGFGAYEQTPFQYSLHIMDESGKLTHKEFLVTDPDGDLTRPLIERMREDLDPEGTVIVWFKGYESQRNVKLAELHPDHAEFLEQINEGMFDLMTIFSQGHYVDAAFKGSSSIKKVLPVIVPELTYKALGIQKGDQAIERWETMIDPRTSAGEKAQIQSDLLEYCKLDTFAMVEIYRYLKQL